MRFVAVGDLLVDVVSSEAPRLHERVHAAVSARAGGSAANAAVWAGSFGATATVVGRVGADSAGEFLRADLAARGIEAHIAQDPALPTGVAVSLGSSVVASPGASGRLAPDDIPVSLAGDALLVSGFSLFQRDSAAGARAALERFHGRRLAVDLASPGLAGSADVNEACAGANVVLATAEEAKAVTGAQPEQAARALAARFGLAAVKLGDEGALAAEGEKIVRAMAEPVERRSRFGAGDAFAAGFLVSLVGGADVEAALERACEAGARAAASEDGWPV